MIQILPTIFIDLLVRAKHTRWCAMLTDTHDPFACELEVCALTPFSLFLDAYCLPGIDIVLARRISAGE
jgi:hypothetical protein